MKNLVGKEIVVFNWVDFFHIAFDLYFFEGPRIRVRKETFWRLSRGDQILISAFSRKTEKNLSLMQDLLEGKTIQKMIERKNGDMVLYLNQRTKLEVFNSDKRITPIEFCDL